MSPTTLHRIAPQRYEQGTFETDDRRMDPRIAVCLEAALVDPTADRVVDCEADNISERGVHVRIPAGSGLSVGQRYEVRFTPDHLDARWRWLAEDCVYGTVVRTEAGNVDTQDGIGVGLRFDQPLFFS